MSPFRRASLLASALLTIATAISLVVGCGPASSPAQTVASVSTEPSSINLTVGESVTLRGISRNELGNVFDTDPTDWIWIASNNSSDPVQHIELEGGTGGQQSFHGNPIQVRAIAPGLAYISCKCQDVDNFLPIFVTVTAAGTPSPSPSPSPSPIPTTNGGLNVPIR